MEEKELNKASCKEFELLSSVGVAFQPGIYVFDVTTNSESAIAASLSNHTIKILDPEKLIAIHSWTAHCKQIVGLKFSPENNYHLFSASRDGSIYLWDLRRAMKTPCRIFEDLSSGKAKPLISLDVNCTGRFLCGGTERIQEDAYILFWDSRNTRLLGGYWETHYDGITQLKFHPSKQDSLLSGSIDGLINLFDVSKKTEEKALRNTINAESSIYKLHWISESEDRLSCLTQTHGFKVWDLEEVCPRISISHDDFRHAAEGIEAPIDYLVDVLKSSPSNIELMSGSFNGSGYIWEINEEGYNAKAKLTRGHTDIIRACHWNEKMKAVITGGEDGVISIWREKEKEQLTLLSESKKITDGEDDVISMWKEAKEELTLSSESKKITGGEDGVISVWKEEEKEELTLSSESKKVTGGEGYVVSMWQAEKEESLSSESKKVSGREGYVVSMWEAEKEESLSSESKKVTGGEGYVVSMWEAEKEESLSSESKKISSIAENRESRKFSPY